MLADVSWLSPVELVAAALIEPKKRKATKPTKASKARRVDDKKKRGDLKRERRRKGDDG